MPTPVTPSTPELIRRAFSLLINPTENLSSYTSRFCDTSRSNTDTYANNDECRRAEGTYTSIYRASTGTSLTITSTGIRTPTLEASLNFRLSFENPTPQLANAQQEGAVSVTTRDLDGDGLLENGDRIVFLQQGAIAVYEFREENASSTTSSTIKRFTLTRLERSASTTLTRAGQMTFPETVSLERLPDGSWITLSDRNGYTSDDNFRHAQHMSQILSFAFSEQRNIATRVVELSR